MTSSGVRAGSGGSGTRAGSQGSGVLIEAELPQLVTYPLELDEQVQVYLGGVLVQTRNEPMSGSDWSITIRDVVTEFNHNAVIQVTPDSESILVDIDPDSYVTMTDTIDTMGNVIALLIEEGETISINDDPDTYVTVVDTVDTSP